jgi:hypothetical protein
VIQGYYLANYLAGIENNTYICKRIILKMGKDMPEVFRILRIFIFLL